MAWDPGQYDKFRSQRARPARDLLAAIPPIRPASIVDLGCGGGALARSLARKWPEAGVTGVDASSAMLAQAAATPSPVSWVEADLRAWRPDRPVDLIVSNAALHWLPGHDRLFPDLLGRLAPGGVLAVQMPRNFAAPSHASIREVAASGRWAGRLSFLEGPPPVDAPEAYLDRLLPLCRMLEVWETEYHHLLEGEAPVLDWLEGTTLVPVMAALEPQERAEFLDLLAPKLASAYPRRPDGTTFFPFRRLFILASP